jgi:hypothetical protein
MSEVLGDLFTDLNPEELEPRLELQIFIDPMSGIAPDLSNNCCRDGGNCAITPDSSCDNTCRDGGNCNTLSAFSPAYRRLG